MWKRENWDHLAHPDKNGNTHHMDWIHVEAIYWLVMCCGFRRIVEVGCKYGYSTSALIQAMMDGRAFDLCCIDVEIQPELHELWKDHPFRILAGKSVDMLPVCRGFDLAIIDGDHNWPTVEAEYQLLKEYQIGTIVAHDVSRCTEDGPRRMMECLRKQLDYQIIVDDVARQDLSTDRGLMIASRDLHVQSVMQLLQFFFRQKGVQGESSYKRIVS